MFSNDSVSVKRELVAADDLPVKPVSSKRELVAADDLPVKHVSSKPLQALLKRLRTEIQNFWKIREVKGEEDVPKRFVLQSLVAINDYDVKKLVEFFGQNGQSAHVNGGTHGEKDGSHAGDPGPNRVPRDYVKGSIGNRGGDFTRQDMRTIERSCGTFSFHAVTGLCPPIYPIRARFIINAWCYSDGKGAVQPGNGLLESSCTGLLPTKASVDNEGKVSIPPIPEEFYGGLDDKNRTVTFESRNMAALEVYNWTRRKFRDKDRVEYQGEEYRIDGYGTRTVMCPPLLYTLRKGEEIVEDVKETELQYAKSIRDKLMYQVGERVQDPRDPMPGDTHPVPRPGVIIAVKVPFASGSGEGFMGFNESYMILFDDGATEGWLCGSVLEPLDKSNRSPKIQIVRQFLEYIDAGGNTQYQTQFFQAVPQTDKKQKEDIVENNKKSEADLNSIAVKRKGEEELCVQPKKKRKMEPIGPRGWQEIKPTYTTYDRLTGLPVSVVTTPTSERYGFVDWNAHLSTVVGWANSSAIRWRRACRTVRGKCAHCCGCKLGDSHTGEDTAVQLSLYGTSRITLRDQSLQNTTSWALVPKAAYKKIDGIAE